AVAPLISSAANARQTTNRIRLRIVLSSRVVILETRIVSRTAPLSAKGAHRTGDVLLLRFAESSTLLRQRQQRLDRVLRLHRHLVRAGNRIARFALSDLR